jgi:hypothetical protein
VIDADGANSHLLIDNAFNPIWSPDGRRLLFKRQTPELPTTNDLYVANADGSTVRKLSSTTASNDSGVDPGLVAQWSPDSSEIAFSGAFTTERPSFPEVKAFLVKADGSGLRLLQRDAIGPSWSPDGTTLAMLRDGDLWAIALDGTAPRRVTRGDEFESLSQWHPQGAHSSEIGLKELEDRWAVSVDFPGLTIRLPHGWTFSPNYWSPELHTHFSGLGLISQSGPSFGFLKPPAIVFDHRSHRAVRLGTTFLEWLATHPLLKTTAVKNIRVAGLPAQMVDGQVRSADFRAYNLGFCGETNSASPCVPLTADKDSEGYVTLSLSPRETFRFITVFLPHGRKLLIQIDDTGGALRRAMNTLSTLRVA